MKAKLLFVVIVVVIVVAGIVLSLKQTANYAMVNYSTQWTCDNNGCGSVAGSMSFGEFVNITYGNPLNMKSIAGFIKGGPNVKYVSLEFCYFAFKQTICTTLK